MAEACVPGESCISEGRKGFYTIPVCGYTICSKAIHPVSLMQRLPRFETLSFASSFQQHRLDCHSSRLSLDLTLSKPIKLPCWASLPTPPMSRSPPAEDTFEPPQLAGTRRKRSSTPPTTTASRLGSRQQPPAQTTREEELTPNRREPTAVTAGGVAVAPYPSSFHTGHQYGYEPGPLAIDGASSSFPPQLGPRELSPKATRKTKAHVASACVNCKKKHLRCDNARPCRRCIQSGKEVCSFLSLPLFSR